MGVSGPPAHGQLSSLSPKDTAGEGRLAFSLRHHWWPLRTGRGRGRDRPVPGPKTDSGELDPGRGADEP